MKDMLLGVCITNIIWMFTLVISIMIRKKKDTMSKDFLIMFTTHLFCLIICFLQHRTDGVVDYITLNWIYAVLGFLGTNVITMVYHHLILSFINERKKVHPLFAFYPVIPFIIVSVLYFTSYWSKWFYYFDENGYFVPTSIFGLSQFLGIVVVLIDVVTIIVYSLKEKRIEGLHFLTYALFPTLALPLQMMYIDAIIVYSSITVSMQFMYTFILVSRDRQYVEASRELVRMQSRMMVSQIQPHFIFNSLSSIMNLIKKDPDSAAASLGDFADYLRKNLDTISQDEPVFFAEELKHTKTYVRLEQLRFKEKLDVHFDIRCKDFKLPPLTVQPLVENAIKHGVTQKTVGGKVVISTYRDERGAHVIIEDDGRGFDDSPSADGRNHVGMQNVSTRLQMFGAKMNVESKVGVGTRIEIFVP